MLLFEPGGELLLIRFVADLDGQPFTFWVTPGGEVESGETDKAAAERELEEELGIRPDLQGPVHQETGGTYTHLGETVHNFDVFFGAICSRQAPHLRGITEDEIRLMREARWWSVSELQMSAERFFPATLPELARDVFTRLKP